MIQAAKKSSGTKPLTIDQAREQLERQGIEDFRVHNLDLKYPREWQTDYFLKWAIGGEVPNPAGKDAKVSYQVLEAKIHEAPYLFSYVKGQLGTRGEEGKPLVVPPSEIKQKAERYGSDAVQDFSISDLGPPLTFGDRAFDHYLELTIQPTKPKTTTEESKVLDPITIRTDWF